MIAFRHLMTLELKYGEPVLGRANAGGTSFFQIVLGWHLRQRLL